MRGVSAQEETDREGAAEMNGEQMRADFEAWCNIPDYQEFFAVRSAMCDAWEAATASKQREIDELQEVNRSQFADLLATIKERDALNKQVLELSAQVKILREAFIEIGKMAEFIEHLPSEDEDLVCPACFISQTTSKFEQFEPSAALLAHDNEVAAKALEEAANTGDWWTGYQLVGDEIRLKLHEMATERRNRK